MSLIFSTQKNIRQIVQASFACDDHNQPCINFSVFLQLIPGTISGGFYEENPVMEGGKQMAI